MNHQEMYAASLIKLFVMEKTYEDYDTVLENDMEYTGDLSQSQKKIVDLLTDMIQISDNEAFNELVRIQNKERSFSEGCEELNDMLMLLLGQERDYKIPAGVPEHVTVANKTGETDSCQHDAAIVFGESGDYILCVMSEGLTDTEAAAALIQEISAGVYAWMEQ
mgnify:CR=1 FL=1